MSERQVRWCHTVATATVEWRCCNWERQAGSKQGENIQNIFACCLRHQTQSTDSQVQPSIGSGRSVTTAQRQCLQTTTYTETTTTTTSTTTTNTHQHKWSQIWLYAKTLTPRPRALPLVQPIGQHLLSIG